METHVGRRNEWQRNMCDEVDSLGYLRRGSKNIGEERRDNKEREQKEGMNMRKREKGSRAAIDCAYFAFIVSYPVVSRSSGFVPAIQRADIRYPVSGRICL